MQEDGEQRRLSLRTGPTSPGTHRRNGHVSRQPRLHRNRTFTVEVEGGNLVFVNSKGNRRPHGGKYLRAVCDTFSKTNSYFPSEYRDLTVNASYILAIIRRYADSQAVTA